MKGGVVVVGNETTFDAGQGVNINATDVLEASKWVSPFHSMQQTFTHKMFSLLYNFTTVSLTHRYSRRIPNEGWAGVKLSKPVLY